MVVPDGCLSLLLAACSMLICYREMLWMLLVGEQMLTSSVTGASAAIRSLRVHTCCSEWDLTLPLPVLLLEVLLRYFQCSVVSALFSLPCLILIFICCFGFQASARVPPVRVRPRTLERPQQRPRTAPGDEGTSAGVAQAADVPSSSGSQTLPGRLACPPDLMTRCWLPTG